MRGTTNTSSPQPKIYRCSVNNEQKISSAWTQRWVDVTTVSNEDSNIFTPAQSGVTVKRKGKYLITAGMTWRGGTADPNCMIMCLIQRRNNATFKQHNVRCLIYNMYDMGVAMSMIVDANANDMLVIGMNGTSNTLMTYFTNDESYMEVTYLGGGTKSPLARIREKIKGVLTREGGHQLSAEVHDASTTRNCDADRRKDLAVLGVCYDKHCASPRRICYGHITQDRAEPRRLSACHLPYQFGKRLGRGAGKNIWQNCHDIQDRHLDNKRNVTDYHNRLDLDGGYNHCVIAGAVA